MSRILAILSLALTLAGCRPETTWPDAPVIVISLDTLRADHLSVYGYERPTSPQLEAFAREGVVFDRFYHSGGGTLPSHLSLMTSLTPITHGIAPSESTDNVLHENRETLAEVLQAAGYRTAAFTDGGWVRAKFGFDQGFDLYDDSAGHLVTILPKVDQWLTENHDEPFFLFVHTYDIHSQTKKLPYECPEPFVSRFTADLEADVEFDGCRGELCATRLLADLNRRLKAGEITPEQAFTPEELKLVKALYDGCIRYADDRVGALFNRLRELQIYERSLIVVLSDHGEEFLEHGMLIHDQGGYDELARIPLLVKFPDGTYGGLRVPQIAAMVDVLPTILDAVGVEGPRHAQGKSLLPVVAEGEPMHDAMHMYNVIATDRWKLLDGTKELYDLENDPDETVNVWDEHPEVVKQLRDQLDTWIRRDIKNRKDFERSVAATEGDVELTQGEIEELRALGYLN